MVTYSYDSAGNRTSADGVTSSFNALNQLTSSSDGTTYSYDSAGRLITRANGSQSATYQWDALDQLLEIDDGTSAVSYSYDALGRRAERTEGSSSTTAHYGNLSDLAILDTDSSGVTQSFVQAPVGLAEQRSGSTEYPLADAHGDMMTLVDGSAGVTSRHDYDPWGERLSGPALEMGWLGAQQRPWDATTGLLQMGARAYDPARGRFLSEDPVAVTYGFGQLTNRYSYAANRPPNKTDLTGRSILDDLTFNPAFWNWGDPTELVTAAQEEWVQSDSTLAPAAGPIVSMADLALNPERGAGYIKAADEYWENTLNTSLEEALGNTGVLLAEYGICQAARKPAARYGALLQLAIFCNVTEAAGAYGAIGDITDEENHLWTDELFQP